MIQVGEELADIRVEHPVHLLPFDSDRERIQRLMRAATGSESVGEAGEVHLVDGVEHLDYGPLGDLVLQRGDAERPLPPVRLRDVRPTRRARPVPPGLQPAVQILKVRLQVLPVGRPRLPVHPRSGLRADRPIGRPQAVEVDVVQQRREPRFLVPSCYLAHTVQRTWRVFPGSVSGTRFAVRVPLGHAPFLHGLRRRDPGVVRPLRRYYRHVRLPMIVHSRITASALPGRPARSSTGRAIMGSPGSRAWRLHACPGSPTARGPPTARDNAAAVLPFHRGDSVGTPKWLFRGSIARPTCTPVNSLSTLRCALAERQRMTRGHRGSLLLRCRAFPSPPSCRFMPALSTTTPSTSERDDDVRMVTRRSMPG